MLREVSPTAAAGSGPGWARSTALLRRLVDAAGTRPPGQEATLLASLAETLDDEEAGRIGAQEARRRFSRAVQVYVAAVFLADLDRRAPQAGVCALDLDGVLEVDPLGFPFLTPVAASALRALMAHGNGCVLATGRSVSHVIDRAGTYGLAGGVAEYGSAIYLAGAREERSLVPPAARAALEHVRTFLATQPGIEVDAGYAYVVRAFEPRDDGPRRALEPHLVARAREIAAPAALRVSAASTQTDFVTSGVDKGTGLRALGEALGWAPGLAPGARLLAFAVGDSLEDLPMLALAQHACAPGNAEDGLDAAGVIVMRSRYQHGFAEAVGQLLGHAPGTCTVCRLADQPRATRQFLRVLSIPDYASTTQTGRANRTAPKGLSALPPASARSHTEESA